MLSEVPVFVPKTVEDLKLEVSDDSAVAQLEKEQEAKRASIRSWMCNATVIGVTQDNSNDDSVAEEEEDGEEGDTYDESEEEDGEPEDD